MALDTETISDAGAHADLTADYRLPALKGAFSPGTPGYFTQGFLRSLVAASLVFANITTTQRDLLTPSVGQVVYDTTTAVPNVYAGGSWQAFALLGTANAFTQANTITAPAVGTTPLTLNQFSNAQTASLLNFHLSSITASNTGRKIWSIPATDTQNGVPLNFGVSHYKLVGGGIGGEDYWNEVAFLGWNVSQEGTRVTTGKAAIWEAWEYKFNQSESDYFFERHMQTLNSTGSGGVRYFSWSVRHDGGASRGFFLADYFDFGDRTGAAFPVRVTATSTGGQIDLNNCPIYANSNNVNIINAHNAANNNNVACLRVDASDRLIIGDNNAVSAGNWLNGTTGVCVAPVTTSWLKIAAGTTAKAQILFAASVAPSSPTEGMLWYDSTAHAFKYTDNAGTKTVTAA